MDRGVERGTGAARRDRQHDGGVLPAPVIDADSATAASFVRTSSSAIGSDSAREPLIVGL